MRKNAVEYIGYSYLTSIENVAFDGVKPAKTQWDTLLDLSVSSFAQGPC
jgi:hypothetical protein